MSHFFSLIAPAPGSERQAAHEWARWATGGADRTAYEDHRQLWRFFASPRGDARDFVFRRSDREEGSRFHVVSTRPPQAPSSAWQVQARPYAPQLSAGTRLAFELRANPVVTVQSPAGERRRHDVVMHEKKRLLAERGCTRWSEWPEADRPALPDLVRQTCLGWLLARAARIGCAFDEPSLRAEGYTQHRGKADELRFSSVDFSGGLTVTDAAAFTAALTRGVGHAKAFGCGLLLVKPLR